MNYPPRDSQSGIFGCERRRWLNRHGDALLHAPADVPPVYLADHCALCRWHDHCRAAAHAEASITLLNGLSRQAWQSLIAAGVFTASQVLAYTPDELRRFKGIGKVTAQQIHTSAQALHSGNAVPLASLPDEIRRPVMMLDIETCLTYEEADQPWSFGWSDIDGTLHAMIVAKYYDGDHTHLPDGRRVHIVPHYADGWRTLADYAESHDLLIYHWSGFDAGVMHRTASPDVVARLAPRMRDFLQVFKQCIMLPVRGRSIKTVAAYLGYAYPPESDYRQAWNDYRAWLLENDDDALARSMAYQLADVEAMLVARDWLLNQS
ncbi:MAG: ribonuclease H-like domain-containing protein [Anaerolineae bacterium]